MFSPLKVKKESAHQERILPSPYQYASGNNTFEDKEVGAEVAPIPRIFAGDDVAHRRNRQRTGHRPGPFARIEVHE